jgi:hypothetical protein
LQKKVRERSILEFAIKIITLKKIFLYAALIDISPESK